MQRSLSDRQYIIKGIILFVGIIFVLRLFYLQIIDGSYLEKANRNVLRFMDQFPARGLIYDRNGKMLVYNEAVYDLMVTPRQVKNLDTALLCELVGITREDFLKRMDKATVYSRYAPSIFEKQISKEDYALLQEKLYRFKGFYVQSRSIRKYPKQVAAHLLGYISEVRESDIEKNPSYKLGDYIGVSGLEKEYEEQLKGLKGSKIVMVDSRNREMGSFQDGRYDTAATAGENLYSSIDLDLQELGEKLMTNKRGSIVAIDPKTGEVLALVSAPCFDPNLLVGRARSQNYPKLNSDISQPLFNRALMASYPPGSIFKIAQALVAMDKGAITPNTGFGCDKSLVGCHNHPSAGNVEAGIKMSCNPYFYQVFKRVMSQKSQEKTMTATEYNLTAWRESMLSFGFGQRLPIDLPNVKRGNIPDTGFYNRWYGKNRWAFSTIYSLSIGQGEVLVIPLQMANFAATVANRGYYYTPHLIRYFGKDKLVRSEFLKKHESHINREYFEVAVRGMYDVVNEPGGTGSRAKVPGINVCGKTGTAENIGKDHAVFIAFAPMEDPKIAISVYVENAGFGGTWAAPIASLMMEQYLKGKIERVDLEKQMIEAAPCQSLPLKRYYYKKTKK